MANTNTNLNIASIDFDEIKLSLKEFLRSQETLKDYDFDGSVLNTIMDILAYNTHYSAFYANMVANEMFLDSAMMRPSIVSHAKALGYTPSSRKAASAVLNLSLSIAATTNTYLSRGSQFIGTDGSSVQYRFTLLDTVYANPDVSPPRFENVRVYEGTLRRVSYVYDPSTRLGSYLLIPNDRVDISTIRVRVQKSSTDTDGSDDLWTRATSYIDLTPTSKVYFIQEKSTGVYEIYFGDDFLGKKPSAGNIVSIEYLETSGNDGNGISLFTTSITGIAGISASVSSGGMSEESADSIKFLAPKYYSSQSRAVTEDDYAAVVRKEYPNTGSLFVYGGETVNPPQYGKVFIALKPKSGTALSSEEKSSLVSKLRQNNSIVTVVPEIIDPDYIDLVLDTVVTYDQGLFSYSEGTLKALIVAYIYSYSGSFLENFGKSFFLSKIIQGINQLDPSVVSNQTTIKIRKTVNLSKLVAAKGFTVDFKNPLYHPYDGYTSVLSTSSISHFDQNGVLIKGVFAEDDGYGKINLVSTDSAGAKIMVFPNIGKIDYDAGTVNFNTLFKPASSNNLYTVTVQPKNTDIFVFENKVLRFSRGYNDTVTVRLQNQVNRKSSLKV